MRIVILLLMALGLASCATPQYQTQYRFTPPASATGKVCLNRCQAALNQCNQQCALKTTQCSAKARQQAALELPGRLAVWEQDIALWERAMRRYETDLRFWELEMQHRRFLRDVYRDRCRPGERCRPYRPPYYSRYYGIDRPLSPGPAPKRPTLASETARIESATCANLCDCQTTYRQCYGSCGGTVQPYQVCVNNCGS